MSVISSSAQIKNNLPGGTVSSSNQVNLAQTFGTASQALTASFAFNVSGTLATSTDGLPEGITNLYYLDSRVKTKLNVENVHSGSYLGTATTTNLTEGINLYFTPARVVSALPATTVSSSAQIKIQADNHIFAANGSTTVYTLSSSYDPSILTVSVDGLVQALTTDYTVSTNQLTLIDTPPSGSNIFVKGLRIVLLS